MMFNEYMHLSFDKVKHVAHTADWNKWFCHWSECSTCHSNDDDVCLIGVVLLETLKDNYERSLIRDELKTTNNTTGANRTTT